MRQKTGLLKWEFGQTLHPILIFVKIMSLCEGTIAGGDDELATEAVPSSNV